MKKILFKNINHTYLKEFFLLFFFTMTLVLLWLFLKMSVGLVKISKVNQLLIAQNKQYKKEFSQIKADQPPFIEEKEATAAGKNSYIPNKGYIPDAKIAEQIAETIFVNIYGKSITLKKPFVAQLRKDGVWIVKGTLPKDKTIGVPYLYIQKSDGKIIDVYQTK